MDSWKKNTVTYHIFVCAKWCKPLMSEGTGSQGVLARFVFICAGVTKNAELVSAEL